MKKTFLMVVSESVCGVDTPLLKKPATLIFFNCLSVSVGLTRPRPISERERPLYKPLCSVLTSYGVWHAHKTIFEGLPSNLLIAQTLWRPIASRYAFQVNLKFFNMTMRCNKTEQRGVRAWICMHQFCFGLLNITFCLYLYNKKK